MKRSVRQARWIRAVSLSVRAKAPRRKTCVSRTTLSPDSADRLADHSCSGGLRKIGLGSCTLDEGVGPRKTRKPRAGKMAGQGSALPETPKAPRQRPSPCGRAARGLDRAALPRPVRDRGWQNSWRDQARPVHPSERPCFAFARYGPTRREGFRPEDGHAGRARRAGGCAPGSRRPEQFCQDRLTGQEGLATNARTPSGRTGPAGPGPSRPAAWTTAGGSRPWPSRAGREQSSPGERRSSPRPAPAKPRAPWEDEQ